MKLAVILRQKAEILPPYHRPLRIALVWELIGIVLSFLVLDFGQFLHRYLCTTLVFWMIVPVVSVLRARPTRVELAMISYGPMLIFLGLEFFPHLWKLFGLPPSG